MIFYVTDGFCVFETLMPARTEANQAVYPRAVLLHFANFIIHYEIRALTVIDISKNIYMMVIHI